MHFSVRKVIDALGDVDDIFVSVTLSNRYSADVCVLVASSGLNIAIGLLLSKSSVKFFAMI